MVVKEGIDEWASRLARSESSVYYFSLAVTQILGILPPGEYRLCDLRPA